MPTIPVQTAVSLFWDEDVFSKGELNSLLQTKLDTGKKGGKHLSVYWISAA